MSIAQPPTSVPYETYVREQEARTKAERERDQWRSRYFEEHKARQQAERERDQERQREQQRRQLWKTKLKPAEKATIEAFQRQLDSPKAHRDDQGFTRIVYKTAAMNIGMSDKAPKNNFEKVLAQCPDLQQIAGAEIQTREEYDQELKRNIPRLYMKTERSLIEAAIKSEISQRKVQGGNQYECQRCHKKAVVIHRVLECLECGHKVDLDPVYPNGKLKNAKDAEPSKTNLSLPPQNGYSAENGDDSPDENFLTTSGQVVGVGYKPFTPPESDSLTDTQAEQEAAAADIESAAQLLLAIAGEDENHIEMSRTGIKKYYDAKPPRPLTLADLIDHLQGGQARGSRCSYRDGRTRGQCFDKDEAQSWEELQEAARKLAAANYSPILEESPAERGGHLWLIYSGLVDAAAARAAVLQIAPELADCIEYWPGPASAEKGNRVRLPGGKYVRRGQHVETPINAWCKMFNAATGESSSDGVSAARLLLASLTDASIVPPLPPISSEPAPEVGTQDEQADQLPTGSTSAQDRQTDCPPAAPLPRTGSLSATGEELEARSVAQQSAAGRAAPLPNTESDDQAAEIASAGAGPLDEMIDPEVDAAWEARYGKIETTTCWFAIMPDVAAAWYNKNHSLESIRPTERNKMALSPLGNERTASTGYYEKDQGERWTDFSAHGRRPDGTHESGDALELAARVEGKSKGAFLAGVIRDMISEGKPALESAARAGQPLPSWFFEPKCIITRAGRRQYAKRLAEIQGEAREQEQTVTPASVTKGTESSVTKLQDDAPVVSAQGEQNDQARQDAQPEPEASAARRFYDAHCSTPGYTLRIRPDGLVGIGVPEDLSDTEFESIAEQVSMHGEALRQIIQERDPQRPGQGEQEQKPALVKDQRVTTPAGIGTVSLVSYCTTLHRWRCSVFTQAEQPDSTHFAVFDVTEVHPIEQGRIF